MHFGATLRLLRLESGLGLRYLARRLAVSSAYLSRVENGVDPAPTPARLADIARELGIPAVMLIDLAQRANPFVADYIDRVPEAGSLFLDIAHRRLNADQLAVLRDTMDERFPVLRSGRSPAASRLGDTLAKERIVIGFTCRGMEDVLDIAAGRLAEVGRGTTSTAISDALRRRETECSSAIGNGVAAPRADIDGSMTSAALVTLSPPLAYDTPDGKPLRLVVVLAGEHATDNRRLLLARVARLAARGLADELATRNTPSELLSRLAVLESWI